MVGETEEEAKVDETAGSGATRRRKQSEFIEKMLSDVETLCQACLRNPRAVWCVWCNNEFCVSCSNAVHRTADKSRCAALHCVVLCWLSWGLRS